MPRNKNWERIQQDFRYANSQYEAGVSVKDISKKLKKTATVIYRHIQMKKFGWFYGEFGWFKIPRK